MVVRCVHAAAEAEKPVVQLVDDHRRIAAGAEGLDEIGAAQKLGGLFDRREIELAMQFEQRVLGLGDDVLGDFLGRRGRGFRRQITHADIGKLGELHLEIGITLAAEPAAETGDGRRRDARLFGKLDDRGIDDEIDIGERELRQLGFQRGKPVVFIRQGVEQVHSVSPRRLASGKAGPPS